MSILPEPIQFLTELLMAELVFAFWLERRPRWLLRLAAVLTVLFGFAFLWPAQWDGLIKMVKYLLLFLGTVAGIHIVFQSSFWDALYRGAAAYAAQHIAYCLASPLWMFCIDEAIPYSKRLLDLSSIVIYLFIYWIIYLCFARRIRKEGAFGVDNHFLTLFLLMMLLLVDVLNYCRFYLHIAPTLVGNLIFSFSSIIGCIFALFIQAGLYQQSQLEQKLEITEHLLHSKQEQFRVSEETIECINLKCHDLKHQLTALRQQISDRNSQEVLKDIESAVLIYDSVVKTGNDALDVILTEKSLICEKNQIQLTCMVDGSGFASISDTDLYSIFGNILDNAIESVMELEDVEQRTIGLTVTNTGNLLLIHTENYYNHPVVLENGLPVTTKEDDRFHGFGMRSVRLLTERYGGTLSINADGSIFDLNIMIPVLPTP